MSAAHDEDGTAPVPMLDVRRQNGPLKAAIERAMSAVCDAGTFIHGPACAELERAIAQYCKTRHAIGCASGSDALLLALMALEIGRGDEVILPSFTFFATAGAVWRVGATPVFADIVPETFNIDPADVKRKITPRTKAIIPVHLFGQCAEMEPINALARSAGDLPVIEDAAQAIGARYDGRLAGSLGTFGCFSFYPSKNLGGFGDGGMLTTNDDALANKVKLLRNHGQHPQYHHHMVGMNSRLDTLQAAVLNVKLPMVDRWAAGRTRNAQHYQAEFARRNLGGQIVAPVEAPRCQSVWNQYSIRVRGGRRDALKQYLDDRHIGTAIYYPVPLHLQECFASLGYRPGSLPHTEQAAREILSLPVFPELTRQEQDAVTSAIESFFAANVAERAA